MDGKLGEEACILPPFPRIFCARGVGDGGYMFTSLQGNLSEGRNWALNGFGSP